MSEPSDLWTVRRAGSARGTATGPIASRPRGEWRSLGQSWRERRETTFTPGWARLQWSDPALRIDGQFVGKNPSNRARRLNEPTWELGDTMEFFLQAQGAGHYLEIHVTPENQRLQLLWPRGGIARVRAGHATIDEFAVADPTWVESDVQVRPGLWAVRLEVPFSCLGASANAPLPLFRACVCRYDWSRGVETLSSTAALTRLDFHRPEEWTPLALV